jgi:hypothetical protein
MSKHQELPPDSDLDDLPPEVADHKAAFADARRARDDDEA